MAALSADHQQFLTHRRAGHFSHSTLRKTDGLARGFNYPFRHHHHFCDSCPAGNSKLPVLNTTRTRASQPLELVHIDLWGPVTKTEKGNCFILSVVDAFTHYCGFFPMPDKQADTVARTLHDRWACTHDHA